MTYRIRRVHSFKHIERLNEHIFPGEPFEKHPFGIYWLAYCDGRAVGFAGLHPLVYSNELDTVFLSRSGVIKTHRGKGLGGRLLDTRLQYCRQNGFKSALTYTIDNINSANNLISRGFRLYDPDYAFGGKGALHWLKNI